MLEIGCRQLLKMGDVSSQASMPTMDALPQASMTSMDATCQILVLKSNRFHHASFLGWPTHSIHGRHGCHQENFSLQNPTFLKNEIFENE
jgi:hypothetical protein